MRYQSYLDLVSLRSALRTTVTGSSSYLETPMMSEKNFSKSMYHSLLGVLSFLRFDLILAVSTIIFPLGGTSILRP